MVGKYLLAILCLAAVSANAAEKKPIADIDADAMTSETQAPVTHIDKHVAITWWMPTEFWRVSFAKNIKPGSADEKDMLSTFSGVAVIAIAEADITTLGTFDYYTREDIEKNIAVTYTDANGEKHLLNTREKVDKKLNMILGIMKPLLGAAMGNLGTNLQFFTYDDRSLTDHKSRLIDPYKQGSLDIQLTTKAGEVTRSHIELPLDSLFVPRVCPDGHKAHISWKYCPWDGTPLTD